MNALHAIAPSPSLDEPCSDVPDRDADERAEHERYLADVAAAVETRAASDEALMREAVEAWEQDHRTCSMRMLRAMAAMKARLAKDETADPCAAWEQKR